MTRVPPDRYTFPWGDADVCPCQSGAAFARCCKAERGKFPYIKLPNLAPTGAQTNYAHAKCYMAPTANCSEGISREHYISEAILERFDSLSVSGMPWQKVGEERIFPTNALAAKILCERHNSALASIDALGLRAFDTFVAASDYAVSNRYPGRVQHYLLSGEGMELWLYKLLAGIHFGGIAAANGGVLRDNCTFPTPHLIKALTDGIVPDGSGLWIGANVGLVGRGQIAVAPLIDQTTNSNIGVQLRIGGIQFEATLVPPPHSVAQKLMHANRKRPRVVDFVGPARDARVILTWPGGTNEVRRLALKVEPEDSSAH